MLRKRKQEAQAAPAEPPPLELEEDDPDALPIFDLLPPQPAEATPQPEPEPPPLAHGVHPIGIHDLTRLAVDNDGRLYWDGKPVEVNRRLIMSRKQALGASVIAVLLAIAALGAAIQGAATAHDWSCRLGWSSQYCGSAMSAKIPI